MPRGLLLPVTSWQQAAALQRADDPAETPSIWPYRQEGELASHPIRRKGVARALLEACEGAARDAGSATLTLHARLADDAALQVLSEPK